MNHLYAIALGSVLATSTVTANNESIMIEVGIGFGGSGTVTKTKEQLANNFNNKFCFHRPQGRMIYGAIRYRNENVEAHVARWFNTVDRARCDRDAWAVGLGYVLDTQNINNNGADDLYASYTPGVAYTWGKNKNYNVQDNTGTNWRLHDNWQMYNRIAIGGGNNDYFGEVAVVRYGMIIADEYERTGENFLTIGGGWRDWSGGSTSGQGAGATPGDPTISITIENNIEDTAPSAPTDAPDSAPATDSLDF
jgi:hypothetical protein